MLLRSRSHKLGSGLVATGALSLAAESQLTESSIQGHERNKSDRRIQKGCSVGTTNYLYDGADIDSNIIQEIDNGGNVLARYTQHDTVDQPLAMLRSGVNSFYQADGLGSITSLSNSSGVPSNTYVYDSFGQPTVSTGTTTNPFRYTGRELDSETGTYYYRARFYDPVIGRFKSEDPTGVKSGLHYYLYTKNKPTNFADPTGLTAYANFPPDYYAQMVQAVEVVQGKLKEKCPNCAGNLASTMLAALGDAHFRYAQSLTDWDGNPLCGKVHPGLNSFRKIAWISKDAFTSPGCCSLAATVFHETVHLTQSVWTGGQASEDQANGLEKKCFGCSESQ
jgi:RHS repeat-associated protein